MGALPAAFEAGARAGALVRSQRRVHIMSMTGRPCRPSEDVKALWRRLLPGTPFPACGVAAEAKSSKARDTEQAGPAPAADTAETPSD